MPGDVDDVVDAARGARCRRRRRRARRRRRRSSRGRRTARQYGVAVPLGVAPDRARHRRPGPVDDEQAVLAGGDVVAGVVDDPRRDAGERARGRAGLERRDPRQRRDDGGSRSRTATTCRRPGPRPAPTCRRNHAHASGLIASPTVPSSRMDDRSCSAGGRRGNQRHEGPDEGRRRVVRRHPVALDDLEVPRAVSGCPGCPRR